MLVILFKFFGEDQLMQTRYKFSIMPFKEDMKSKTVLWAVLVHAHNSCTNYLKEEPAVLLFSPIPLGQRDTMSRPHQQAVVAEPSAQVSDCMQRQEFANVNSE